MEKYARQAVSEGVKNVEDLQVGGDSEIYRVLNLHYNRNNHIEVWNPQVRNSTEHRTQHASLYDILRCRFCLEKTNPMHAKETFSSTFANLFCESLKYTGVYTNEIEVNPLLYLCSLGVMSQIA